MRRSLSRMLFPLISATWAGAVGAGICQFIRYENTPGAPASPPPVLSAATPAACDRPTLVLLLHPHCPCSRATLGELAKLMTDCDGKLNATVLMLRPAGVPDDWARTDLWDSAAAIPGVTVRPDPAGDRARRFGAATSGQALLYAADGRLLFAGGITESRGHGGDNAGRDAITALVLNSAAPVARTPVYGCPLFDAPPPPTDTGVASCRN